MVRRNVLSTKRVVSLWVIDFADMKIHLCCIDGSIHDGRAPYESELAREC